MEDSLRELAQAQAAAPPTPERDRTGERLGRFQITGLLGRGGMGVVYAALDLTLRRKVALKLLQPEAVGSDEQRRRFVREARAAAAVSHPNIAQIYEVGEAEGEVFLALELVEGSPLREHLRQAAGALPEPEALSIAREIARGLATAHEAGVVHRDVKPENVMLTPDGRVKILDFGLAKLHGAPNAHDGPTASAITTHAGLIVGSPGYMAPEQARGLPTNPRSDIFSLGIVLFEMLAGARPFQGPTSIDILSAILRDEPPALRGVSASLNAVVARCLEKDPAARYANAGALLADLETLPSARRWRPRLPPALAARLAASETLAAWRSLQLRHRAVVVGVTLLSTAATWFLLRGPTEADSEPTTLVGKPAPAGAPTAITELPRPSSANEDAIEAYQDALQYFRDADWVKARASLRRALALDQDLAAAHLRLAIALSSPDRLFSEPVAEAFQAYSSATHLRDRLSPRDRGMLEALEPAMRAGSLNMAEAVARLARLTERYPDDAEVAQLYASYLTFGPPAAQLAAAERALRIDGKYADAWQTKGTALARQKSPDELAAYAQCLAIVPTSSDCWWSRAMAESRLGRCAAAETSFRRRAEDDANTLPELAGLLYAQGKPLESVQEVLKRTWALYDADVAREEELYDRARL
ncbi:MAG: serine/threonine protein kinase, partial [Polyangiaceae bacterium]|nr:serine/threonine protein kinase [Polyangiaceae bacterium]